MFNSTNGERLLINNCKVTEQIIKKTESLKEQSVEGRHQDRKKKKKKRRWMKTKHNNNQSQQ